ncbi:DUF4148 domain-containing protein [Paraburkholderia rhizosphaerae]|uniref:Uncharacterized protein DUF4148 n=1 Tax=Paraburkholderia rhizosphaerae TaxID=480658 RepID=A0A4R8L3F6_9BURK|nr:DUF4148 domain-containing protein [Paraburkholderia rhizosphaerae]TDY37082.1 uncharacterized protein DUF4148 [Paraburkholderia rhizosphaerae]
MKTRVSVAAAATIAAALLAAPAISFAQQSDNTSPVTRAQVRAELIAAEKDGSLYLGNSDYPGPSVQTVASANNTSSGQGVGGAYGGTSQWGSRTPTIEQRIFATFRGN